MLKPVIIATALLAFAGGSTVYAQQSFGDFRFGDRERAEFHHRPSAADVSAFADARIAALKAGLELTPDQAKNWPPFEEALGDMVQLRLQRIQTPQAGNEQAPASPFERLARRADDMAKRSAALKKLADAGTPLYQSLDEEQKGRFVRLAHMLRPHSFMHGDWHRGEGDWRRGEGDWHGWGHDGRRFDQEPDQE
jgi:LTXXQ motif family protein